ncbi:hypothetical protein GCM10011488_67020 [Steroidobacter agaridevorans]|nr:hypothetical protein GCM10011488_67020 [Steroidobacter agaridevorans]
MDQLAAEYGRHHLMPAIATIDGSQQKRADRAGGNPYPSEKKRDVPIDRAQSSHV